MYVSLMRLGFSSEDVRAMPITIAGAFIRASNELTGVSSKDAPVSVRKATQADIDRMLA